MPREVHMLRSEPSLSRVYVGAATSAAEWFQYARLANFVYGKGSVLVPETIVDATITSGSTWVFRFYTDTRAAAVQRVWNISLRAAAGVEATVVIKAPASTGTAQNATVPIYPQAAPIVYVQTVTPGQAETEITLEIAASGGNVVVERIYCAEVDRPLIASSESIGVVLEQIRIRQALRTDIGLGDVADLAMTENADARRVGMYHLVTDTSSPWTRVTNTYAALTSLGVPVLAHKDLIADTTGSVKWRAYAKVTGGTGVIKIATSNSGVSSTVNVTGTSWAWTNPTSISIDCDDMTMPDGLPAATWDELTASIQGPGGADTLSVASISVYRSP